MIRQILILIALIWAFKDFNTLESAVEFMNTLPEAQRERAYVIALNSQRSGYFNGFYSVIYPTGK